MCSSIPSTTFGRTKADSRPACGACGGGSLRRTWRWLASFDKTNEVRIWALPPDGAEPLWTFRLPSAITNCRFNDSGDTFAVTLFNGELYQWQLSDNLTGEFRTLRGLSPQIFKVAFDPRGRWIATTGDAGAPSVWPVASSRDRIVRSEPDAFSQIYVSPSGDLLAANTGEEIQVRPFPPTRLARSTTIFRPDGQNCNSFAVDWQGGVVSVGGSDGGVWVVPLAGGSATRLYGFTGIVTQCVLDPHGRYLAACGDPISNEGFTIVWDLETRLARRLKVPDVPQTVPVKFTPDGQLLTFGGNRLEKWNLDDLTYETILDDIDGGYYVPPIALTSECQRIFYIDKAANLVLKDLVSGERYAAQFDAAGAIIRAALSADGWAVALGSWQGSVHYWCVPEGHVYSLYGHAGMVNWIAIDPQNRWIVSTARDRTMRLWSVPEGPPLESLAYPDLLAKLRTATNLRVVRDPEQPNGFKIDLEPIEGWEYITARTK